MRCFLVFLCYLNLLYGQEKTPFLEFNSQTEKDYNIAKQKIEKQNLPPLERLSQRIQLASRYKNQEDLIKGLEQKIALVGENARLRYLLGGANGIKALQVSRMFSIPYVKAMLYNFERSLALDPTYIPALEAYIESLCMVPSLLGGDTEKAKRLAKDLLALDEVQGHFAFGFIAKAEEEEERAKAHYSKALKQLEKNLFCSEELKKYFAPFSMNYPYKIAEKSLEYQQAFEVGQCSIEYFIEHHTPFYNLPLEWAHYKNAQLLYALEEKSGAQVAIQQSLAINPDFELAKKWKVKH